MTREQEDILVIGRLAKAEELAYELRTIVSGLQNFIRARLPRQECVVERRHRLEMEACKAERASKRKEKIRKGYAGRTPKARR